MQYHKQVSTYFRRLQHTTKQFGLPRIGLYGAGLLVGISSLYHWLEWLPFICLVPVFLYVNRMHLYKTRQVVRDFYVSGLLLNSFAFLFLLQVKPNNWAISLPTWIAVVGSCVALSVVVLFCSLPLALLGWLLSKISNNSYRILTFLALWPLYELIRSYGVAIASYGPGNRISPNFNFGSLASIAAGTPLVFAGRITGFFGLSLLVLLINLGLYSVLFNKRRWHGAGLVAVVIGVAMLGWSLGRATPANSMKVAVVHVNEAELLDNWSGWKATPNNVDLLVLPEYSEILNNPDFKKVASKLTDTGLGVTSRLYKSNGKTYNQMVYFDHSGNIINQQNKTFIIPTGESMPYFLHGVFYTIGQKELVKQFNLSQQITPGGSIEHPFVYKGRSFGSLICSGATALSEYPRLADEQADVFVNAASLSFLTQSSFYHTHARNMARFHAVTNRKPFIQASRSGQSFIMTSQGHRAQSYSGRATTILSGTITY